MKVKDYISCLRRETIPSEPPDGLVPRHERHYGNYGRVGDYMDYHRARERATHMGCWTVVDKIWTAALADWINGRRVLEVMAGRGWTAKALKECGVKITATDDDSWNKQHSKSPNVFPVQRMSARDAVAHYGRSHDLLLVSWPPYGDTEIDMACDSWGSDKPIIFIGEMGAACATDEFCDTLQRIEDAPEIPLCTWSWLYDEVVLSHRPTIKPK